jgi:hypothetical protein
LTPADGNPPSSTTIEPYPAVDSDLASLALILERTNRLNILEYGVGHSTMVFARHIWRMQEHPLWATADVDTAKGFPVEATVVDASMEYIGHWAKQLVVEYQDYADGLVTFHHKRPELVNIGNQIVSCYPYMPKVPPDFIYIDAPEGYQTKMPDAFVPIIGDVLRYEAFLLPNTIIVIDGRAMQARFLFRNLKNTWAYRYCEERDQHFFVQVEGTRGLPKHEKLIKEVYYANGPWTIEDL